MLALFPAKKMPVAELFLGAFLQVLFDRLASPELLKFGAQVGLHSKLKKWEKTLKMIEALLVDAEEKQLTDRAVKVWLDDLQELAYDVEDILDEIATETLRQKLMAEDQASTGKVRSVVPAGFSSLSPSAMKFNIRVASKTKKITNRLDEISTRRDKLGLKEIAGRTSVTAWERPPSTSVRTEPAVYGRDEDKAKILEMALNGGDPKFRVIPIVGMGGIGKTTLAREVYNDRALEEFKPRGWVCVHVDSDVLRISKAILESITRSSCDLNSLDAVQNKLKDAVAGRRFLLVLDDVWKMNYGLWESLKSPFMVGAPQSTIIVTTRSMEIARTVAGPSKYHELKTLSNDHCWYLFKEHAGKNSDEHRNLELFRPKVVEKCRGLPLAARTLGGLLNSKKEVEWEDILNSKIWDLSDDESDILPVLKLSYYYLPSHLKRCFAYCAIFPKDYKFGEKELVLLWMAEGFIQQLRGEQQKNMKQLEDLGSKYFHNLLSRSIFQQSSTDCSKFTMHDLIHDLAEWVSEDVCFRKDDELRADDQSKRFEDARYSSYSCSNYEGKDQFEIFYGIKNLRTFLPTHTKYLSMERYISDTIISNLLPKLKKLRVLSLRNYYISELPNSIGSLKHLRYLNLSNSKIKSLPEPTCSLFNLQTLILRECSRLLMLPSNMKNLINLQYLDISGAILIRDMPMGMKALKSLLQLSNFIVGKTGSSLKDLKYLVFLRGELSISSLKNAVDFQDAREFILSDQKDLEVLLLEWRPQINFLRDEVAEDVLDILQPHKNLKELTIRGYGGTIFPSWLGDPSFSNMVGLTLESCANCSSLPPLGLLGSLKNLSIRIMKKLKSIGSEMYGEGCSNPFQSLETLCFESLGEWEHWEPTTEDEHVEIFSRLKELSISSCPKLSGRLPNRLPCLEKLVISNCEQLVISFSSLPMLRKLEIDGCKQMAWSNIMATESLNSVSLSNVPGIGNWSRQGFQTVESLKIVNCEELVCSRKNDAGTFLRNPPRELPGFDFYSLKELCIESCNALTRLPNEIMHKEGLETLELRDCDSLEYVIRGRLPPSLKRLYIRSCENLQCLFDEHSDDIGASSSSLMHKDSVGMTSTSHLEYVFAYECPSLMCLSSTGQLPATLTDLKIWNCSNLAALSLSGQLPATLTHLELWNCSNLMTLMSGGQFPKALKSLSVAKCPKLDSIAERFDNNESLEWIFIWNCVTLGSIPDGLHTLSNIRYISVRDCPSLVSFPEGGFPNNITEVSLHRCGALTTLPNGMHALNHLRKLEISQCPSIVSFPEGLPTSLASLDIEGLNIYNPLIEWGLGRLTSLTELEIVGCSGVVSFPPEERGIIMPSSLTALTLQRFPNLKYLSSRGFQDLNSLESLTLRDFPNLKSLPCLPCSLLKLNIRNCPLLKKRCRRGEGRDWSKIKDIPCVEIDARFIYDPEEED